MVIEKQVFVILVYVTQKNKSAAAVHGTDLFLVCDTQCSKIRKNVQKKFVKSLFTKKNLQKSSI